MNRDEMRGFMPHRGLNQLIDEYCDTGEGTGEGRLTIGPGVLLGRDLFLTRGPGDARYLTPFLVEHAALASLLVIRSEMTGGRLAFFSTVSRFRAEGEAVAGTPLVSFVKRGRDRGEFRNFDLRVESSEGAPMLSVSFMAFLAPTESTDAATHAPGAPAGEVPADPAFFPFLAPSLSFVSPAEDGACRGTYPAGHPHVAGHFPGAPVMMGMAQWLAVAQAAALSAPVGRSEVAGAGRLVRDDGTVVVEVTGLRVEVDRDETRVDDLRLLATKRVAFREKIVPGDSYSVEFESA